MNKPLIKICGIKNPAHAILAAEQGADFIGLIFHEKSPRAVSLSQAKEITQSIHNTNTKPVCVFVDQTLGDMLFILKETNSSIAQLHGNNARKQFNKLPSDITKIYVVPVDSSGNAIIDPQLFKYLNPVQDYLLFDGLNPGSGKTIPLNNLNNIAKNFRFFIAGGISVENVNHIIETINPHGIDVSSSLEIKPGEKSEEKIVEILSLLSSTHSCHPRECGDPGFVLDGSPHSRG